MPVEQRIYNIGFLTAAADLSAKQYRCVKVTADEKVNIATAAGEAILGVLQNKPVAGDVADVGALGVTKIIAGVGGLAAGKQWETAADGSGIEVAAAKVGLGTIIKGAAQGGIAMVTIGVATGATIAA